MQTMRDETTPQSELKAEAIDIPEIERPAQPAPESKDGKTSDTPEIVALLPLRGLIVYPLATMPLRVQQPRSIKLIEDAVLARQPVGLVATLRETDEDDTKTEDLFGYGTLAMIGRNFRGPDGVVNMFVHGGERFRIVEFLTTEPYITARIEMAPEPFEETLETEALKRNLKEVFQKIAELRPDVPDEFAQMVLSVEDARQITYACATFMRMEMNDAKRMIEMDGVQDKMLFLLHLMNKELEVLQLGKSIQSQAQGQMEKVQREYYLREQMKAIQKELGETDEQQIDVQNFREKIEASGMNDEARKEAERELDRLSKLPTQAAEYGVIRTYLDWMTSLPWQKTTPDNLDIKHARQVLDEDHFGLNELKDRILEFLAVRKRKLELSQRSNDPSTDSGQAGERTTDDDPFQLSTSNFQLRPEREGVILCFVGPPGVGKTSLGASIARAMGRKFIRMAVGGVRDEAEIRGFRRTYIGSMPGRVVQSIRRAESRNPVFMLDEVDKLGSDYRGDPSSALLEVLDPEQNRNFRDHYLDVPFDLSQAIFICTANALDTIPGPLRDRMEILSLSSYTEREKLEIAKGYLVPRQLKENGARASEIVFTDDALLKLMRDYTREAGVRNYEREIGSICRKLVTRMQEGKIDFPIRVDAKDLSDLRGKPKFYGEVAERTTIPGVATGMSWTPVGGDILFIEATKMSGSKGFQLTGQLGDVMKESAQAAMSYIKSNAKALNVPVNAFDKSDIHIHVPAGATPKDGPSAGVTMATAMVSLLTNRKVRPDVAMTGEITLRGSVLPVGGIKEKVLAAHRAGLKTIILPKRNEPDLDDLPKEVRDSLRFVLAERVEQVLDAALMKQSGKLKVQSGK
jgi:ATP-dependent Lon protease